MASQRPAAVAAPSCVIPGTVAHNAHFLARHAQGRIGEIALCFFETQTSLAYTEADLPEDLADLPFSWHVHLPVDLPWGIGPEAAANCALRLMRKAAALAPRLAVLHAPDLPARKGLLAAFAEMWHTRCSIPLLLENTDTCDLVELGAIIADADFGICLDLGHMLAYGQQRIVDIPDLRSRVRLTHWSAPGGADRHLPLAHFTREELRAARSAAARLPDALTHLLEIFDWNGLESSLDPLQRLVSRHDAGQ